MMDGHVLIETFGTSPQRHLLDIPDEGLRLHIHRGGRVIVQTADQFCKTCGGGGRATYFYAQDHRVDVACPTCNDGDQKRWDREAENWSKQ